VWEGGGEGIWIGKGVEIGWAYNSVELLRLEHQLVLQPAVLLQLKRDTRDELGVMRESLLF